MTTTKNDKPANPPASTLEYLFAIHLSETNLPTPEHEYRFHDKRRWRFDFAWPDLKIVAEIEGGTYKKSRHTSAKGFKGDCQKYNQATLNGWQVYRFDAQMVNSLEAINTIKQAILEKTTKADYV